MKRTLAFCMFSALIISSCHQKNSLTYPIGQIITPKGEMLFWLYNETPIHKKSFIELANAHYWDSLTFNRVINGFVIQGGCPDTPEGFSGSPYLLEPEFVDSIKHVYGAVGAGRDDNPKKLSAGCQLYIVHDKDGIERLDGNYTIFGQIFKGLDVLNTIATVQTDSTDTPLEDVTMEVNVIEMAADQLKENGYDLKER